MCERFWTLSDAHHLLSRDTLLKLQIQERRIRNLASSITNDIGKAKIQKVVEDQIDNIAHTELIDRIRKKIETDEISKKYVEAISLSVSRIKSEIDSLQSRGNLNLSIGIVSTIIGIIMLGSFVFTANYQEFSIYQFIYHFIPRISLVVFIQVFAFFFLGLYKANIGEIKYYHNELTAVEARISAVVIAVESSSAECMTKVVSDLSSVDRNATGTGKVGLDIEQSTETLTKFLTAIAPFVQKG